jgi:hypothetical protein
MGEAIESPPFFSLINKTPTMNTTNNFRGEFEVTVKNKAMKGAFTMNALRLVMREEKIKLDEFDKYLSEDPLTAVPTIGYFSIVSEAAKNGKKVGITLDAFIAEVLDSGQLEAISDALANALKLEDEAGK